MISIELESSVHKEFAGINFLNVTMPSYYALPIYLS